MSVSTVLTPSVPRPVGPYSSAVRAGDWLILSGQLGRIPDSGQLVDGGSAAQTRQILANIVAILGDCAASLADVAKTTIFVTDIGSLEEVNATYAEVFGEFRPARSMVEVAALPGGAAVEIEVWAHLG
ncbi:RidA family protein [Mycobacterium sp. E1747]|uniref:RidA family protein n=1 Tax=Mycobacterium sp. E1747 TaxID=1834128 RepID=UPI0007FE7F38|nr:Rid family detoxifying hydrolase [Mycobacterium sp. E1747]OBH08182.1 hypothetical protein A5695_26370 [Mycobacterium sp. E1747]